MKMSEETKDESESASEAACSGCDSRPDPEASLLSQETQPGGRRGLWSALVTVPAAAFALLPSFTCPACLAAYSGVLSSLGLGVVLKNSVLTPLIAVFLLLGIVSVARATRSHKQRGPLVATVLASILIVVGRLIWNIEPLLYAGAAVLVTASIWNLWLKRPKRRPAVAASA